MELRQLEMFVATAEEGSVRGGARRLSLAQPSVTSALKKLERSVGVALFERSYRGVALTAAGKAFYEDAHAILRRLESSVVRTRAIAVPHRPFRIGLVCGAMAASELTSSIVSSFIDQHGDLDVSVVELTFSDQYEILMSGQIHAAIVRPPFAEEILDNFDLVPVFREPRLLCFPAHHRFADAETLTLVDVLEEPVVHLSRAPGPWSRFWGMDEERGGAGRGFEDPANTVSQLQMTLAHHDGVMSVSSSGWRMGMSNPHLRALPVDGLPPMEVVVAVPHAGPTDEAMNFAESARMVCRELIDQVPGAQVV